MHQMIYEELKRVAKGQRTICYGPVAHMVGLDLSDYVQLNQLSAWLGEISTHEHRAGRPMLSAVVVATETNMPGIGFFKLARELGVYRGVDDLAFFVGELRRVHAFWKDQCLSCRC